MSTKISTSRQWPPDDAGRVWFGRCRRCDALNLVSQWKVDSMHRYNFGNPVCDVRVQLDGAYAPTTFCGGPLDQVSEPHLEAILYIGGLEALAELSHGGLWDPYKGMK